MYWKKKRPVVLMLMYRASKYIMGRAWAVIIGAPAKSIEPRIIFSMYE